MLIPFEVVHNISSYLSKRETLECLVVCKSWSRPMLESLYSSVTIKTCRSFRSFLYVIAHHELNPGKFVKKLELYIEDFSERPPTFTEFELLTRYCTHLNVLLFSHNLYWRCMNELDFSNIWPYLHRVPISRDKVSFEVCNKIKERLEQVAFCAQDEFILRFLSSPAPKLLKIDIATRHILLKSETLIALHYCAPLVQELCLMVCMENITPTITGRPTLVAPIIEKHMNHVESLKCLIHHPDSSWFSIIKSTYHSIDTLALIISNITPRHQGYTSRHYTKFEIVRSIIDLIRNTNVRELEMDFKFVDDISFMQATTATILYDHCNDAISATTPVSVKSSFIIPGDFDYHHRFKSKLITKKAPPRKRVDTNTHKKIVHYELEYRFVRELDEENENYNVSELDLLEYAIIKPINKLVLKLLLDIGIGGDFLWSNVTAKKRPIFLDQVLNYFSNLESLTLMSSLYDFCGNCLQSDVRVTLSSSNAASEFKLEHLTIKSVSIDRCIYRFLFKHCTALSTLTFINCQVDDVTTLALECLCLEANVKLDISQ